MLREIVLKLGGSGQAIFNFTRITSDKKSLRSYIVLSLHPALGGASFRSIEINVMVEDWFKLCQYFEEHISTQQVEYPKSSSLFMTYELQFKIQALAGDVISDTEGTFSLRFLVNIGNEPDSRRWAFSGVEVVVQVSDIREFVDSLRSFLTEITQEEQSALH